MCVIMYNKWAIFGYERLSNNIEHGFRLSQPVEYDGIQYCYI